MCGLTGFSGKKNFHSDKIKMLMLANMTRGVHATGMFSKGEIIKEADDAITFLAVHDIPEEKIFLGHDRAATVGNKTNAKNAHPFKYNNIVGMHNGTLKNHWDIVRANGKSYNDFDVDSQVLIYFLSVQKDFKILQEFEGAAAIIWHDTTKPNRLYVFRNNERPLFRGYRKEGMYISSIEESLEMIGCERVQSFKTQYLYVIEDGEINVKESKRVVKKKSVFSKRKNNNSTVPVATKQYSIDRMCDWVLREEDLRSNLFTKGKWYKIVGERGMMFDLIADDGRNTTSAKTYFTVREELDVNSYVLAPIGDGEYIDDNEVLFLRGLELKEGETYAVLEKINEKKTVYTWPKHYIRNLKENELDKYLGTNKINTEGVKSADDFVDDFDKVLLDFIEDEANFDDDSNRLGNTWMEIGSIYEDLLSVSNIIGEVGENVQKILEEGTEAERDNLLLDLSITVQDLSTEVTDVINTIVKNSYNVNAKVSE